MWQCQGCEDRDVRFERSIEKVEDVLLGWRRMQIGTRALPIQDTMALLVSLVNLALNTYPDRLEYVDQGSGR
jgi:hypothetical protein